MITDLILLQTGGGSTGLVNIGFILLMFGVFWFFIMRPQAKKQKQQRQFMEEMKSGDKVVTASGILGEIVKVEGDIVTVQIASKVNIRVTKSAISKELTESVYAAANPIQKT